MAPAVIASLVSAGSALASSALQSRAAKNASDRSFSQTKELFGMQQADRDSQNHWNSPAAQITRLRAAGLSPAAFYGNGQLGGTSAGVATPGSPEVFEPDVSGALQAGATAANTALLTSPQLKNVESQSNLNDAKAIEALANADLSTSEKNRIDKTADALLANMNAQTDNYNASAENARAQAALANASTKVQEAYKDFVDSEKELNGAQKREIEWRLENEGPALIKEIASRTAKNYSDARLSSMQFEEVAAKTATLWRNYNELFPIAAAQAKADLKLTENKSFNEWLEGNAKEFNNNYLLPLMERKLMTEVNLLSIEEKQASFDLTMDYLQAPAELVSGYSAAVSDAMEAALDVATFGTRKALLGSKNNLQEASGRYFNNRAVEIKMRNLPKRR